MNHIEYITQKGEKYGGIVNLKLKSSCCVDPVQLKTYIEARLMEELKLALEKIPSQFPAISG